MPPPLYRVVSVVVVVLLSRDTLCRPCHSLSSPTAVVGGVGCGVDVGAVYCHTFPRLENGINNNGSLTLVQPSHPKVYKASGYNLLSCLNVLQVESHRERKK
jgi:hypothetical protein